MTTVERIALELGPSPSRLGSDPAALALRESGYEVTDFAGAFVPGAQFRVGLGPDGPEVVRGPLIVEAIGTLRVESGTLCCFDPVDATYIDRTGRRFDRDVSTGEHPVFVSLADDEVLVELVRVGTASVVAWTPASLVVPLEPTSAPMMRSATRFAVAVADASAFDAILEAIMVAPDPERLNALFGPAPSQPGETRPIGKMPGGKHPTLEALRAALRSAPTAVVEGIPAFRSDASARVFWGLDAHGGVAALACDFGRLRIAVQETFDVRLIDVHMEMRVLVASLQVCHAGPYLVRIEVPPGAVVDEVTLVHKDGDEGKVATRIRGMKGGGRDLLVTVPHEHAIKGVLRIRMPGPSLPGTLIA